MVMLDFDTVRYCNLVAYMQKNVYINACYGVGRTFSWGEGSTNGAVSIQVIPETCIGGELAKLLELSNLTNLPLNISEEQKRSSSTSSA